MRLNRRIPERFAAANDRDPREGEGAQIIDLATRNVLPSVSQRRPKAEGLGLAAGVAFVALVGGLTLWSMDAARQVDKGLLPPPAMQQPAAPAVPVAAPVPQPSPSEAAPAAPPQQAPLAAPPPAVAAGPASNPHATPTIIFDASALPAPLVGSGLPVPGAVPAGGAGNSTEDFASRIGGVGGTAATATASIDPKTTVAQGTLIQAVLETAIDTDVPGYVRAIVSSDVRSYDGSRVLVPRSSRLIGQYRSGMQAGQKRAYVIWTRLLRPDGVTVNIASPAVTFSGETGLEGKVNSHFFERFGSAMLLSVVGGLSALGGNAGVIIGGSGQSAAAAAVGQSGQIGPTVRVRQGQPIRVFTARDLDFSKVQTL
ncbi:MAG: TrbI/VirB10 family protein [Novosphingobium sp.]